VALMAEITFTREEREILCRKIQMYLREELGQEVGQFDAGFLLDFFAEEIGTFFYNRGLYDAQAILETRLENIAEAIYELEKPTPFVR
jgi:uncharacterized protein (DUF2164 family)